MTWHILFLILIWSDLIYWHDYIIFYHFHSNPISIVPCAVSAFTTFLRPSPTSVRQEQPGFFPPPGADRFLIAHGMEKFTEASTFQVGRSKGWYVPQPSHPISWVSRLQPESYLFRNAPGYWVLKRDGYWWYKKRLAGILQILSLVFTCFHNMLRGIRIWNCCFGLCSVASLESINHYKDAYFFLSSVVLFKLTANQFCNPFFI